MEKASGGGPTGQAKANDGYEAVRIEKTRNKCGLCEEYAERHKSKPGRLPTPCNCVEYLR